MAVLGDDLVRPASRDWIVSRIPRLRRLVKTGDASVRSYSHEAFEHVLDLLEVCHVARRADHGRVADLEQSSDVLEPGERTVRGCPCGVPLSVGNRVDQYEGTNTVPRQSAASMTPSLNLSPRTEVPVTIGCLLGGVSSESQPCCLARRRSRP